MKKEVHFYFFFIEHSVHHVQIKLVFPRLYSIDAFI